MALYDWNKEGNWDRDGAFIVSVNGKGYAFFQLTKRAPRHCSLRHIFVLEEFRGQGVGEQLIQQVYDIMLNNDVNIIRFFANKPAVGFYEKLGYKWLGESKGGLPFTYTDINTMECVLNEKQLNKLYKRLDE
jgi:ribosomal protein S18 acetylase RimI-like enzyme